MLYSERMLVSDVFHSMILVTGMSGAGQTSVLKIFEDIGYETIDNLPLHLLGTLLSTSDAITNPICIGVSTRTRGFEPEHFLSPIKAFGEGLSFDIKFLFLDCDDDILIRRFTETRRRHPLALDIPIDEGIRIERHKLSELKQEADYVIDTSRMSLPELRQTIMNIFTTTKSPKLFTQIISFSYPQGIPRHADLVLDVRCFKNPHYVAALKDKTGLDEAVQEYIQNLPEFQTFITNLKAWLGPLIPLYITEGKSYLTIAIGCTGGKHRSVYTAQLLYEWLNSQNIAAQIYHRELNT